VSPDLEVRRAGLRSTVQDLGRPGYADLGVPRSGAADAGSLRLANRLVGNPEEFAGIETTLLGVDLDFHSGRWVAVTGAVCPVTIDGRAADPCRPQYVPAGATLRIGTATRGVRSYVAVAGGIAVAPVLASRSTDTLSGIGPPPLADAMRLPLGPPGGQPSAVDIAPRPMLPPTARVRLVPGPRDDRFTEASLRALTTTTYRVTVDSDRIGVRLRGAALAGRHPGGLPSEGVALGAVQVPPDGQPLVFLADHPTTGGYPVVGVVHPADLWQVAQAAPGTAVRFSWHRPT